MFKTQKRAIFFSLATLVLAYLYQGLPGLRITSVLILLEVGLSLENAIFNANYLHHLTPLWRQRFLTWGFLIALFGIRFLLPLVLVALSAGRNPLAIVEIFLHEPKRYAALIQDLHPIMACFGGLFLVQTMIRFFQEKVLAAKPFWCRAEFQMGLRYSLSLSTAAILGALHTGQFWSLMSAGCCAVLLDLTLSLVHQRTDSPQHAKSMQPWLSFVQLELLDLSFSLDAVVAAFAMTSDMFIILLGLGAGAYFVRTLTIELFESRKLTRLPGFDAAAHISIGLLGLSLLLDLVYPLPSSVMMLACGTCLVWGYWRAKRLQAE